jgi:hypothetical protein
MVMHYEYQLRIQDCETASGDMWQLRTQMAEWCLRNLGTQGWLHDPHVFEFEHEQDYLACKITWS